MTVLSPTAKAKFFDSNGAPAAGYKLFTYVAGTTTKLATYTDSTGGTPNSNPIILDFRGECNLWVPPNVSYKYTFAPATDTDPPTAPIWTVDNIVSSQLITLYGGVDTGIANAYVLNFTANFTSYTDGIVIYWIPSHTNTGASTMNVNGLGVVNIVNPDGTALYAGQIQTNQFSCIIYSGGVFKLYTFGLLPKINTQNNNYTFALTDGQGIVQANSGVGPYTWTIPANATTGFPIGTSIDLINNSGGTVTIAPAGIVSISGPNVGTGGAAAGNFLLPFTFTACKIVKVGTDAWQIVTIPWQAITTNFTGTLTGMTVATTGQINYTYLNTGTVILSRSGGSAALTGTSNANTMTLTGMPAFLQPKFTVLANGYGIVDNGSASLPFVASISAAGVVTFLISANPPANFTAAGTKGLTAGWQLTYQVL